jgi:hypothetical protein
MYFANVPDEGPIHYGEFSSPIGVLAAPDDRTPLGTAHPVGRGEDGLELWKLVIAGAEVLGRFVVIDRRFVRA